MKSRYQPHSTQEATKVHRDTIKWKELQEAVPKDTQTEAQGIPEGRLQPYFCLEKSGVLVKSDSARADVKFRLPHMMLAPVTFM